MVVAVTGASGFVGGHVCESLMEVGHDVRAVVRTPSKADWLLRAGATVHPADVLDAEALHRALQGADAVVANAAMGSWQGELDVMQQVNVEGVRHTLHAAARAGVRRVVLVSSVAVYQTRLNHPMDEQTTPTDPRRRRWSWRDLTTDWRYSLTKTRGELLAWELADSLGLDLTAVRPGPVYGERDPKLTARLLSALDRRVVALPTARIPLVHARDVADAITVALDRPQAIGQAYNLAGPPVSTAHLVRRLAAMAGRGPRVLALPVPVHVSFDCSAAERDLGFQPRDLPQALQRLLTSEP